MEQTIKILKHREDNMTVREFLINIAENELIKGQKFDFRIPLDDGGENSYVGFSVHDSVKIFRHTNSVNLLDEVWSFELGSVIYSYHKFPDVPLLYSSYEKERDIAEKEAAKYYNEILKKVRKKTSEFRLIQAETIEQEKAELLERLAELENEERKQ